MSPDSRALDSLMILFEIDGVSLTISIIGLVFAAMSALGALLAVLIARRANKHSDKANIIAEKAIGLSESNESRESQASLEKSIEAFSEVMANIYEALPNEEQVQFVHTGEDGEIPVGKPSDFALLVAGWSAAAAHLQKHLRSGLIDVEQAKWALNKSRKEFYEAYEKRFGKPYGGTVIRPGATSE